MEPIDHRGSDEHDRALPTTAPILKVSRDLHNPLGMHDPFVVRCLVFAAALLHLLQHLVDLALVHVHARGQPRQSERKYVIERAADDETL